MSQRILFIETEQQCVRSEAIGWSADDSWHCVDSKELGQVPGYKGFYTYSCVLRAMHHGWKVIQVTKDELPSTYTGNLTHTYTWILTKD